MPQVPGPAEGIEEGLHNHPVRIGIERKNPAFNRIIMQGASHGRFDLGINGDNIEDIIPVHIIIGNLPCQR